MMIILHILCKGCLGIGIECLNKKTPDIKLSLTPADYTVPFKEADPYIEKKYKC